MKTWSFEEEYILCKVCDEYKYVVVEDELLDTLMYKLEKAGSRGRSGKAVLKRAYDCMRLLCGENLPNVSAVQRERCQGFNRRKQMRACSEELQSYLDQNYAHADETMLKIATNVAPNTMALLPIGEATPTFIDLLRTYISRNNMTEPQVYKHAQIGRDTFSNIYSGKRAASKEVVMRLCFGLKLTYDEAVGFMAAADHGFNTSTTLDLVVVYFLQNKIYDTYAVNVELHERNEKVLFDGRYTHRK